MTPLTATGRGQELEIALDLWRRGLSVIPVPRPRRGAVAGEPGDGKTPSMAWRPYRDRRPTEDEIRAWFAQHSNIAVVTGAVSGVVVIDADSVEALRWCTARLPYTPWQTKTSRGFHLWYQHPRMSVPNRARIETSDGRLEIDVRGDGGYVIAPGSIHASGIVYEFAGDWSVARDRLPTFWPGWLQRPTRSAPARAIRTSSSLDLLERARRYLAAIPPPVIGQGSDAATLYAAARLVRGFGLSEEDAAALLWEWAGNRPGWTFEWVAAKARNASRYGSEPIGALR